MSVFTEFKKLWSQKFPENSLTSEWKDDVRTSLKKHKEKIDLLEKEIEKEKLYCIYLEKLLNDAEKYQQNENETSNETVSNESFTTSQQQLESYKDGDAVYLKLVLNELQEKSKNMANSHIRVDKSKEENCNYQPKELPNQYITVIKLHNSVELSELNIKESCDSQPSLLAKPHNSTHKYENVIIETQQNSNILKEESTKQSFTTTFNNVTTGSVLASAAAFDNPKKKLPPKPPPKFVKRAPVETPSVPSKITFNEDENESKPNSNSESCYNTPTGSLKSLPLKKVKPSSGSKESLASLELVSDKIMCYETISSLNSDGSKIGLNNEKEHFYDQVPNKNIEGDYVYLNPGELNSNKPRSPLTVNPKNQLKSVIEPESPGRNSNYVNIDYFLQNEKSEGRNSSLESDGDQNEKDSIITPTLVMKKTQGRNTTIRQIITSIINSETLYVDCLNRMIQYMKAIRADLSQPHPVICITQEEFETMFFKIDELYVVHNEFLSELRTLQAQEGDVCVGNAFEKLTNQIDMYGAFLHNYGRAIETVKKCGSTNSQFRDIVSKIVLNSPNEQTLTLEDLLHKPVARVQKNALNLQDLLNNTPNTHADYNLLKESQRKVRSFLSEFNVPASKFMLHDDKALRRLVKNSFMVEHSDGHRKLRHLFLFNDVIACAKYKASGRDRFEFELKWYISLQDIQVLEEMEVEPKEANLFNLIQLKSQACTVRDQIMLEEKEDRKRVGEKHRKKLADLEAQLVLASPNLQSCNLPGSHSINVYDLQAWIIACQSLIKTEMGSYLLRSGRDECLLIGDLQLTIQNLTGLEAPADLFVCVEVDSYGHYFRKAKTKLISQSTNPNWNETFTVELEGSQNVRFLLYEDDPNQPFLRAKYILQLSRKWLNDEIPTHKLVRLSEKLTLNLNIRFIPGELSLRRVPTTKPGSLFGSKLQNVLKRERREIPFIITSCIREVERRGICEVGIYRVSGSTSDLLKLKKSFETNSYEAEQLLKEVDIHSVTGILKTYLRELPEALFTDLLYQKLFETFNKNTNVSEQQRSNALSELYVELPPSNQAAINLILDHLIKVNEQETENKMSLHNLAMVFGPTLLRPGKASGFKAQKEFLESSTVDVMAQAGILYCFLFSRLTNCKEKFK
uniref:CSON014887 protein n=1 Tax=Culicoides sonorensis TaxID=179676 RepID=A0A336KRS3_CULSO